MASFVPRGFAIAMGKLKKKAEGRPKTSMPNTRPIKVGMTPTSVPALNHLGYTTEEEIRRKAVALSEAPQLRSAGHEDVQAILSSLGPERDAAKDAVALERRIQNALKTASDAGRLLTERQYQDLVVGRRFTVGDKVRYIGPERSETAADGQTYLRLSGVCGMIVDVKDSASGRDLTWRPDEPLVSTEGTTKHVEIIFREYSKAFSRFERID